MWRTVTGYDPNWSSYKSHPRAESPTLPKTTAYQSALGQSIGAHNVGRFRETEIPQLNEVHSNFLQHLT